jgi:hypothetical protein
MKREKKQIKVGLFITIEDKVTIWNQNINQYRNILIP